MLDRAGQRRESLPGRAQRALRAARSLDSAANVMSALPPVVTSMLTDYRCSASRVAASRRCRRGASTTPPPPSSCAADCRSPVLQERLGVGRQRRHFVGIERAHQARRDQHHQLGLLGALRLALEQVADDRQLAQERNRRRRRSARCCPAGRQSRTTARRAARRRFRRAGWSAPECGSPDSVTPLAKSSELTSGLHFQANHVAGDRRREVQPDAELLEHDRHRCRVPPCTTGTGNSPPARKLASWPL